MPEEFINECITHPDIRHLRLYNDYMDIYEENEHQAKIIRILETWTNTKLAEWYKRAMDAKDQGKELPAFDPWITMSFQQFRLYMYGTASEETIKKNLGDLQNRKHIERRVNPENPYGPPQYKLMTDTIQAAINKRGVPSPTRLPHLEVHPPTKKKGTTQKDTPLPKTTPAQWVQLPPARGEFYPEPGGTTTPSQGGILVPSNNSKNLTQNTDQERGSHPFSESHTLGPLSPDALAQVTTPSLSVISLQEALAQLSEQERTALLAQYGLPAHSQAKAEEHDAHARDTIASAPNLGGVVLCECQPASPDTVSKARRSDVVATRLPPALRDLSETQDAQESAPTHIPVATDTDTSIQGAPAPLRGRFLGVIPGEPAWKAAGQAAFLDGSPVAWEAAPGQKSTPERAPAPSQSDMAFSLPGDTSWVPGAHQAVQKDEQTAQAAAMKQEKATHPLANEDTKPLSIEQGKMEPAKRTCTRKKHPPVEEVSEEQKRAEEEFKRRCSSLQSEINEKRGGPLRSKGAIINEATCIQLLVREFTDRQIRTIWQYLVTEDWRYKGEKSVKVGGKEILEESRPVAKILRDRRLAQTPLSLVSPETKTATATVIAEALTPKTYSNGLRTFAEEYMRPLAKTGTQTSRRGD